MHTNGEGAHEFNDSYEIKEGFSFADTPATGLSAIK
jgi:hypothetical protein